MKRKLIGLAVAAALVVAAIVYLPKPIGYLRIAPTFAAQQTCACVHVSARELGSCLADLGKAGSLVDVRVDGDVVHASSAFGLFTGAARHEPPFGCHPVQ